VVDGGEDRGDDGHDCLLGAAPRFDAVELGLPAALRSPATHAATFSTAIALLHADLGFALGGRP
jgi:hypothetical protein